MMLPIDQLLPFAMILCLAIFTQSATGFAAGLVVIPLMVWAGHGIPEAQSALLAATIPQNTWGVIQYRSHLSASEVALPATLRVICLPLGIAVLFYIDNFPVTLTRQIVGVIVIFCVVLLVAFRPQPNKNLHPAWQWVAFTTSGFFQGCTGTGGPMMVLWVQSHDWSTKRTRAFLFVMYLVTIAPAWGLLYYWFGSRILAPTFSAFALLPLLLVGTWLGLRAGTWLGRERLRRVTMGILVVIGLMSILTPLISMNGSGQ